MLQRRYLKPRQEKKNDIKVEEKLYCGMNNDEKERRGEQERIGEDTIAHVCHLQCV